MGVQCDKFVEVQRMVDHQYLMPDRYYSRVFARTPALNTLYWFMTGTNLQGRWSIKEQIDKQIDELPVYKARGITLEVKAKLKQMVNIIG